MKRFITLLLIAAIIALSLIACDGGNNNDSMKEIDDSELTDQNQGDTDDYTNDLGWDGIYSSTESYENGWLFMEITDYDGNSFGFKFYDSELMYLEGAADIRPDEPHKADYMGITFTINADTGEITVDGSDYGTMDGTYARYEDGDIEKN